MSPSLAIPIGMFFVAFALLLPAHYENRVSNATTVNEPDMLLVTLITCVLVCYISGICYIERKRIKLLSEYFTKFTESNICIICWVEKHKFTKAKYVVGESIDTEAKLWEGYVCDLHRHIWSKNAGIIKI